MFILVVQQPIDDPHVDRYKMMREGQTMAFYDRMVEKFGGFNHAKMVL